jgi:hypothetical protein
MPYAISDTFLACEENLLKNKDNFVSLAKGWLQANAEINTKAYSKSHAIDILQENPQYYPAGLAKDTIDGVRFTTFGDNKNFF